jgi:hypothetical protein
MEAGTGIEPVFTDLQSGALPRDNRRLGVNQGPDVAGTDPERVNRLHGRQDRSRRPLAQYGAHPEPGHRPGNARAKRAARPGIPVPPSPPRSARDARRRAAAAPDRAVCSRLLLAPAPRLPGRDRSEDAIRLLAVEVRRERGTGFAYGIGAGIGGLAGCRDLGMRDPKPGRARGDHPRPAARCRSATRSTKPRNDISHAA